MCSFAGIGRAIGQCLNVPETNINLAKVERVVMKHASLPPLGQHRVNLKKDYI